MTNAGLGRPASGAAFRLSQPVGAAVAAFRTGACVWLIDESAVAMSEYG
jgi:hypothetical protein